MKKLIINADDFGATPQVCDAILEGLTTGIISSTSVITNFEDFHESARPLVEGRFPCGVHLNIFSGLPVLAASLVPSLVDSSRKFRGATPLTALRDGIRKDHLGMEFRAQIERLLATGARVTHIDNHRPEIYGLLDFFQVVVDLAVEYGLPIRMPYRTFPADGLKRMAGDLGVGREELATIGKRFEKNTARSPDYFLPQFLNGPVDEDQYAALLSSLPEGVSELCVHPSLEPGRGLRELDVLRKFDRRRLSEEFGVELVDYGDPSLRSG